MRIARLSHRAWHDNAGQGDWLKQLVWAVDDLKISLQLGMRIKAFSSFHQFEQLALLTGELGKQSGGWYRQYLKGQQASALVQPS